MYTEDICTISRTDDDKFIVNIKQKRKADKKSGMIDAMQDMKTFIADTEKDVAKILSEYLPKMKKGGTDEDAFKKGYEEGK